MKLHNDAKTFKDLVVATSRFTKIAPALIEKDYYVTLVLNELNKRIDGLLFKGGTCLAKCYKVINRFSEDIDLTLDNEHFTQSKKREANKVLISLCDCLNLKIINRDVVDKHSHGSYNCYEIEYPIQYKSDSLKPFLMAEVVFIQKAYPDEAQMANSYIGEYLLAMDRKDLIKEYELESFAIRTQALQRTLVDKVFAICDYYLRDEKTRNSRHIYDIYCLLKQ